MKKSAMLKYNYRPGVRSHRISSLNVFYSTKLSINVHILTVYTPRAGFRIGSLQTAMGPMRVSIVLMPPSGPKLDVRARPVLRPSLLLSGMGRLQLSFVIISRPSRVEPTHTGLKCPSLSALDKRLYVVALPPS